MDSEPWWIKPLLAGSIIVAMLIGLVLATFFVDDKTLKITMFTTVGAAFLMTVGYYFGSASSGAKKDDTIAAIASSAPTTAAPAALIQALDRNTLATGNNTTGAAVLPASGVALEAIVENTDKIADNTAPKTTS